MNNTFSDRIADSRIIGILRGIRSEDILSVTDIWVENGINCIEIAFDQSGKVDDVITAEEISMLKSFYGNSASVGAGTVITENQARLAADSGAEFFISPNTDESIIRFAGYHGIVSIPGCFSPTEIIAAIRAGSDFQKVFPAGILGPSYFKAVLAPVSAARLIAVGNVNENNAGAFIRAGAIAVGIGSFLSPRGTNGKPDLQKIRENARFLSQAVRTK